MTYVGADISKQFKQFNNLHDTCANGFSAGS